MVACVDFYEDADLDGGLGGRELVEELFVSGEVVDYDVD